MPDFIPKTREAAVADCVRVALEYTRRKSALAKSVGRRVLAKGRRIKAAADWKAELFRPMGDA
jgi:hypothetical protein